MAQPSSPTSIILSVRGLHLNPSTFGDNAPNGALTIANNVVIDRPSVVATRRGFNNAFSTIATAASSMFQYASTKLLYGTDHRLYADVNNDGVFTAYSGTYTPPSVTDPSSRVRGLESNRNFYFITGAGTYRLDSVVGQPRLAGAPPGLSGSGVTTGATGFLPASTNVAYRVVFGYRDANQQLVLGAPSSRIVVSNTGATSANVIVTFQIPKEIQLDPTNFFFQVYRGNASANLATEPDDEMALTYEDVCTGAATQSITDITPDSLLGASLYTNQGQDGILQSNYRPPWALDVCTFKQYAFYANTRTVQLAPIALISAGASNGADAMIPGDTITFTANELSGPSFTLTAAAANNTTTGEFQVSNTGNPAYDIQVTASNIALVANAYAANTFLTAYYTSTGTDLPGKLRFDRLTFTVDSFTITSSRSSCWEQALPVVSDNEVKPNRIYFSKFNQPEAVPVVNYIDVGSANAPINRVVPLRDGVMILKQDGVFRISNAAPPFTVTPIDFNVRILAPNTAAELDNKVYFLSDQGVVTLTDSDAQIKSFVLDRTIIENTSPTLYPNLQNVAWGIAYQSDRKYILFMPATGTETQSTQQYVYNHLTDVWTRWTLPASCGIVFKRDGKLYLGSQETAPTTGSSYVYQERKTFTEQDYADNQYTTTCGTSGPATTIIIDNPQLPLGVNLLPGWTITQFSSGVSARIVSATKGLTTTTVVVDRQQNWSIGPVVIYTPVYSEIETIQIDCENPGMNKQFNEIVYMFTEQGFSQLTARVSSDTAGIPITDYLTPQRRGGWGIDPWGPTPWGGGPSGQGKIRRYVPQRVQRAGWLYFNIANAEAFTSFGFSGIEIFYKNTSSRQK
jgi:hypothetical protein